MRNTKWIIPLLMAISLTACDDVVALHPLYDERSLILEPSLYGSWTSSDHETWTFEQLSGKTYKLIITDKDSETLEFDAALVELSGFSFLDLSSRDTGLTGAPGHIFAKIKIDQDTLHVAGLNNAWMKQRVVGEKELSYLETRQRIVVTAPTLDLQHFFRKYAAAVDAFSEDEELHRVNDVGGNN